MDTADSIAFIITHVSNIAIIQKTECSGHGFGATHACPHLPYHAMPCLYAPLLLECRSGSLRDIQTANPTNLSSGKRSPSSGFAAFPPSVRTFGYDDDDVPYWRSVGICDAHLQYCRSSACGKLCDCAHYDICVPARHKIVHVPPSRFQRRVQRRNHGQVKPLMLQPTPRHAATGCAQNHACCQGSCAGLLTQDGVLPSAHCTTTHLSNIPVMFFLLEHVRPVPDFCSNTGSGVHHCNCRSVA